jgi:hypothetical protein
MLELLELLELHFSYRLELLEDELLLLMPRLLRLESLDPLELEPISVPPGLLDQKCLEDPMLLIPRL